MNDCTPQLFIAFLNSLHFQMVLMSLLALLPFLHVVMWPACLVPRGKLYVRRGRQGYDLLARWQNRVICACDKNKYYKLTVQNKKTPTSPELCYHWL